MYVCVCTWVCMGIRKGLSVCVCVGVVLRDVWEKEQCKSELVASVQISPSSLHFNHHHHLTPLQLAISH